MTYDIPIYSLWINRDGTMFKLGFVFKHEDALALLGEWHDGGKIVEYTIDFLPKLFGHCKLHRIPEPPHTYRHKIRVPANENTCTVCNSNSLYSDSAIMCCGNCDEFVLHSLMPIKKEMLA